jgi:protein-tyrosine-phosphatase
MRQLRRLVSLLRRLPATARSAAVRRAIEPAEARVSRRQAVLAAGVSELLFVCHGNIMRSAFAAEVARRRLVPGATMRVHGAGTHASPGRSAEPAAIAAAASLGIPLDAHRSSALRDIRPHAGILVLCMDRANEAEAMVWAGSHANAVFLIGDIGDTSVAVDRAVADPYGRGEATARDAFSRIRDFVDAWIVEVGHAAGRRDSSSSGIRDA